MEMNEILMLIGVVIVGYLILKFLWNVVGNLIKLVIVVIVIGVSTYLINPELIYNAFGKENVEAVAKEAKEAIVKVSDVANDATTEVENKVKDTVTLSN